MDFKFDKLKLNKWRAADDVTRVVEFVVPEDEAVPISKVLDLTAVGRISAETAGEDVISVAGRVNFKLLYSDENGIPGSLDYFADFSEIVPFSGVSAKTVTSSVLKVDETDISADDGLTLSAVVRIVSKALETTEYDYLTEAEDGVFSRSETVENSCFVTSKALEVDVSDEKEVRGGIDKILLVDAQALVVDAASGDGTVLLNGDVNAIVTYLSEGKMQTVQLPIAFSEEYAVEGAALGDKLCVNASVKSAKVVLTGVEGESIIRVDVVISARVFVTRNEKMSILYDLYSLDKTIEVQTERIKSERVCATRSFTERLVSTAELAENTPAVRDILAVTTASNSVAQASLTEDGIRIEGAISVSVLYTDENGINSVDAIVPYSETYEYDLPCDVSSVSAVGIFADVAARVKRDREIELSGTLISSATLVCTSEYKIITAAEEGEAREVNKSAFSVYIADEGEDLWDASKALGASPEDIMRQNPTLEQPLAAGTKIVYFRRLHIDF